MKGSSSLLVAVSAMLLLPALLCACRTTRSTNGTVTESVTAVSDSACSSDTVTEAAEAVSTLSVRDSAAAARTSAGHIDIARDTAGRPVRISWVASGASVSSGYAETSSDFSGWSLRGVSGSSASKSTASEARTHTDTAAETRAGVVPAETVVGSALLALFVIYVFYVILADYVWPWIQKNIR